MAVGVCGILRVVVPRDESHEILTERPGMGVLAQVFMLSFMSVIHVSESNEAEEGRALGDVPPTVKPLPLQSSWSKTMASQYLLLRSSPSSSGLMMKL